MSLKNFSVLVLMFFIGCSTTPVKYDNPVKVDDYKYFVRLKEKKDDPVSKKTFGQKIKEAFTTKTDEVEVKKTVLPRRRVRETNTNSVTNSPGKLMSMDSRSKPAPPRDVAKTIMLYLIYLQAAIIAIFAYTILRRQRKAKKVPTKIGELNL